MNKKITVLFGSPRKNGNTKALLSPFLEEAKALGYECDEFDLFDMKINDCICCLCCQKEWNDANCAQQDDMQKIFASVKEADRIIIATPIYSWNATAPVKAVMDRLVYGMNKYYGEKRGPSIWAGKHMAVITTCGYPVERGADLFEECVKRYCTHSRLKYDGMLAERNMSYNVPFMDSEKEAHAREFANRVLTV